MVIVSAWPEKSGTRIKTSDISVLGCSPMTPDYPTEAPRKIKGRLIKHNERQLYKKVFVVEWSFRGDITTSFVVCYSTNEDLDNLEAYKVGKYEILGEYATAKEARQVARSYTNDTYIEFI